MQNKVYVWDKFIRLFHWSLVTLFVVSYVSGESESIVHIYSGYGIVALLVMRVIWGFIGTSHARFRDFVRSRASVLRYSMDLAAGKARRYLGHNPLGGAMVVAMLVALSLTTLSGLKLYAVEEGKGPLANETTLSLVPHAYADRDDHETGEDEEEVWEEIHEFGVNLMLLLIGLHIAGVVFSSRLHGESLVKAMVNGYKKNSSS